MKVFVAAFVLLVGLGAAPSLAEEKSESTRSWLSWENPYDVRLRPWAYIRMGYENVEQDDRFNFIGSNDGFVLDNARVGIDAAIGEQLSVAFSVEGASDVREGINSTLGEIDVRVRDAFLRWDPFPFVGIQGGQFKAPFAAEELRSRDELLFVSRAVGQEGVLPGRGFEEGGVAVDRQLGFMISPRAPLSIWREVAGSYYLMIANGNGENEVLNDNTKLAVIGRGELHYADFVTVGGAFLVNDRTSGVLPNQSRDEDTGFAADVMITPFDLELFFQYVEIETEFKTVSNALDRTQRALHVQVGYTFELPWLSITPGYRYALLDPFAKVKGDQAGLDLDSFRVDYHTLGVRFDHLDLPLALLVNYTFTEEKSPREIDNDRLQILTQVSF